jgi:hypothetical protein
MNPNTHTTKENEMDILRTDRTYKTRANAVKALAKLIDLDSLSYVIAVNEDGRFAPIAILDHARDRHDIFALCHNGVTVVG